MKPADEPPVPEHVHAYDWEDDGVAYEATTIGVRCGFSYEIPPGPRGKKPRRRYCGDRIDMDDILRIINFFQGTFR